MILDSFLLVCEYIQWHNIFLSNTADTTTQPGSNNNALPQMNQYYNKLFVLM